MIMIVRLLIVGWILGSAACMAEMDPVVLEFAKAKQKQAHAIAAKCHITVTKDVDRFFDVATRGNWGAVSNAFESLLIENPEAHNAPTNDGFRMAEKIPGITNELWACIHETHGAYETWYAWKNDSGLIQAFTDPILREMPTGSVYFGGTDHGRFFITTANEAQGTPRIIVITQNALADARYMAYLRAAHEGRLILPTEAEYNALRVDFARRLNSAPAIMAFNAVLVQWIVERNKAHHQFYYEESYYLDSLMPYLQPHGLIMKISTEPVASLSQESIGKDMTYWSKVVTNLLASSGFKENPEAQKAFSHLRCAIADIYLYHRCRSEAESCLRQALRLWPDSPTANVALADILTGNGRFEAAKELLLHLLEKKPDAHVENAVQKRLKQIETETKQRN